MLATFHQPGPFCGMLTDSNGILKDPRNESVRDGHLIGYTIKKARNGLSCRSFCHLSLPFQRLKYNTLWFLLLLCWYIDEERN